MNAENIQLFTQYQKQLQEAEKSFQKKVYALQEDVQKLNKAYQNKLLAIDKHFMQEEKSHADQLKHIDQVFSKESKDLTQDAIENRKKYQTELSVLEARWAEQEKVIKAAFENQLAVKEKQLRDVQKEREKVAKTIEKDYQDSKAKLERVKTVTTEIFEEARSTFQNSLSYYLARLQSGTNDDQDMYKKEVAGLKKDLKIIEKKQSALKKIILKSTTASKQELQEAIGDYQKEIGLIQSKVKAFVSRTMKKYDSLFVQTEDGLKKTQTVFKAARKKIFDAIESQRVDDFDLVNQYEASITTSSLKTVYTELQSVAVFKNDTLTHIYTNLTDWAERVFKESFTLNKSSNQTLQSLLSQYSHQFTAFISSSESIFNQLAHYDQFKDTLDRLFIGQNIPALIEGLNIVSAPLLNTQKKWHQVLYKVYKESQEYYNELDEIQAFFDSFDEEKALAFENEQVHITRRAAQLDVEVETAKKQYEFDSLSVDQNHLFEKNKNDHLVKEFNLQEKKAVTQAKAALAVKDLEIKNIIAKAKNDYQLKNAFFTVEYESLDDRKKYRLADIKEAYAVKRFEVEKKKAYALYELKLNQNSELDQHALAKNDAKNQHQRDEDTKKQFVQELESLHSAQKNAQIFTLKKEIDEFDLQIKRVALDLENELRSLQKVYDDETSVPLNRLKEFDKSIGKRLKSIDAPYQARLRTFAKLEDELNKATPSVENIVDIVSLKFKDDMLSTVETYYETLKWTREYYSDLEISKIKRSDLTMKKQGQELDSHQDGEHKYIQTLNTYAKAAEQSIGALFDQIHQQLSKKEFTRAKDLVHSLKTLHRKLLKILEEQTTLTTNEIVSLFNYIKEQDEAFLQDVNYGLGTAEEKINADFKIAFDALNAEISARKSSIQDIKDNPLSLNETQAQQLEALEETVLRSQRLLSDLELEKQQKLDRFKSELQSLNSDFTQQLDSVDYQYQSAVETLENEIKADAERIEEKRLYAEKTFGRILEAQKVQAQYFKNRFETLKLEAHARTQNQLQAQVAKLAEQDRIKERKMIEIESRLNRTLDDIQTDISSREIQLETAKEKVSRQYDSLYFDYQNRAQMLNEKLKRLQKFVFAEREILLLHLKTSLTDAAQAVQVLFAKETPISETQSQFEAHIHTIDTWIQTKKDAIKAGL